MREKDQEARKQALNDIIAKSPTMTLKRKFEDEDELERKFEAVNELQKKWKAATVVGSGARYRPE